MRVAIRVLGLSFFVLTAMSFTGCAGTTNGNSGTAGGTQTGNSGSSSPPPTTSAAYLKASNTNPGDQFAFSLALATDGNTLAVGAPLEDSSATGTGGNQGDDGVAQAGAVYIFTRSGTDWAQEAYVKASNTQTSDQFGLSVALSSDGNTLAVGTPLEDSNATGVNGSQTNDLASQSGAVYIFTRTGVTWSQQAYLKASNREVGDEFGRAISLSGDGNTLAVGARLEDSAATGIGGSESDNLASQSGAVYVFTRSGTLWSQQAYIKASNTGANDWFGATVALSNDGNTLAVGAEQEDSAATGINGDQSDNFASDAGAVYVFTRNGGTWSQEAYVKASNAQANDLFGVALTLSGDGNTMAVGACCEDSNATGINSTQENESASGAGAAYVFTRSASIWSQQAYVKSSNTGSGDQFGLPLVLSNDGNTLVVGAALEDSSVDSGPSDNSVGGSGAAYVFTRSGSTWSQQHFLKASNANSGDHFGTSIAVSGNGAIVVAGASLEDSSVIGINGNSSDNSAPDAGAVFVY